MTKTQNAKSAANVHPAQPWLFRSSSILWVLWGVVHIFAGAFTLFLLSSGKTAQALQGIVSKVPLESLKLEYPAAVIAILSQHAYNLAWFGVVTLVAAWFVWKRNAFAIFVASLVGGLADFGYFLTIDLGGYAAFPGPQMTYICAAAIITGAIGLHLQRRSAFQTQESQDLQ